MRGNLHDPQKAQHNLKILDELLTRLRWFGYLCPTQHSAEVPKCWEKGGGQCANSICLNAHSRNCLIKVFNTEDP
ncbi:hypothetical protein Y1Q_0011674 [Alligator mississippiensis]|uniref:Uncharacterized protein n=1 Tax=Alligator mississippiensis TaxID=8496 RepID=A0A151M0S7_ALLMI|nr:hypothetical protein Y1Q_0011674 [Alligator mississippiensis]